MNKYIKYYSLYIRFIIYNISQNIIFLNFKRYFKKIRK